MGFALAQAALRLGWNVDLVAGPVALPEPEGAIFYPVVTAEEMFHQTDALFDACDICIMAAAVSDFRPATYQAQKVKKADAPTQLELERTPDILATLSQRKLQQTIVGFAAETQNLADNARAKLAAKNCDLLVANDLTQPGSGFAADTNTVTLFTADGSSDTLGPALKTDLASQIIDRLAALRA
jgi:phosphopantothenoylcysteine decarboxylase/phosphopantothenate--cysteine ligase